MKPEAPLQNINTEPIVQYEQNIEQSFSLPNPETGIEKSAELFEQKSEIKAVSSDIASIVSPILNTNQPISNDIEQNSSITGDSPLAANDDDLIEKEWVDKAKKIVAETKDDPFLREEAVNKLQIDYLKKRYGRNWPASE